MKMFEIVNNINLIENNILHILYELSKRKTNYFRIAKESYTIFYRTMIESLKGSANHHITKKKSNNNKPYIVKYQNGNKPWVEIHNIAIDGCNKAWRFSQPSICEEPEISNEYDPNLDFSKHKLIDFFEAIAMIQSECFYHLICNEPILINDDEMKLLEHIHDSIRNEFEHFIPKEYILSVNELITTSLICINKSIEILFIKNNVFYFSIGCKKRHKKKLSNIKSRLDYDLNKC